MKYIFWLLIAPMAFVYGAKNHEPPSPGQYFYCAPDVGEVKSLEVTKANAKKLGKLEVNLVCDNPTHSICALSSLVSRETVDIKNDQQFVWSPQESKDCGAGCFFRPILFSKNRVEIGNCSKIN